MSHTFTQLIYHIVWGTKNREPIILSAFEEDLHDYVGGCFKTKNCFPIKIGGMSDHIHVLLSSSPNIPLSEIIRNVKVATTKWMRQKYPEGRNFAWQEGYGAFSVSASNREVVLNYIKNQKEHHKKLTFQEEFLALLRKHGINFDEKYFGL